MLLTKKQWFYKFAATELLADLMAQSLSFFTKIVGIVISLYIIGAESIVAFVLGTAGVIGLGISFAFKDIIENYIAGIILSIRQPFNKEDHILVSGHEGIVQRMTTRITMIKTFDGNNISIPNAQVFNSSITNYTKIPERRFGFTIGIDPNSNANTARQIGLEALKGIDGVLETPASIAHINSIGDSSIILEFFGWLNQSEYDFYQIRSLAISAVKEALEDAGVEIPDPSYIIKLKNITEEKKINKLVNPSSKDLENLISPTRRQSEVAQEQIKNESLDQGLLSSNRPE